MGARPNFIKIAPIIKEMGREHSISPLLLHTGQHYGNTMSGAFFKDLDIKEPDIDLGAGSDTHVSQIARIMIEAEKYLAENRPDLLVLVGDVNSTLAMALVGNKMGIPICHIEAGLRSRNLSMPEEYNRIITDRLSELLFTPTEEDTQNLLDENIDGNRIFMVGNIMIDSLLLNVEKASSREAILHDLKVEKQKYALITLHRPECVDIFELFHEVLNAFERIQKDITLVWPLHPRTKKTIKEFNLQKKIDEMPNLKIIEPVGYLDMLMLMKNSSFVMTDSGGLQEETTVLGIPCLTLRNETERPVTVTIGTNKVVGTNAAIIISSAEKLISGNKVEGNIPPLWDGKTAKRIVDKIVEWHHREH